MITFSTFEVIVALLTCDDAYGSLAATTCEGTFDAVEWYDLAVEMCEEAT